MSPAVLAEFEAAGDLQGKVVAAHADRDPVCAQAMDTFIGAYGSEAGVAALKWLPLGGLFLAGGLTPKHLHRIEVVETAAGRLPVEDCAARGLTATARGRFLDAFHDKGRLSPVLLKVR